MTEVGQQEHEHVLPREIVADSFVLRALEEADPEEFLELIQDPDIQKFIPWASEVKDIASAVKRLSVPFGEDHVRYGIYQDGSLAGYIGAWREDDGTTYQTGSALAERFRGQGLTNRAFLETLKVLKGVGAQGISCYVSEENEASKANVTKRGLQPTEQFNEQGERRWEMSL